MARDARELWRALVAVCDGDEFEAIEVLLIELYTWELHGRPSMRIWRERG